MKTFKGIFTVLFMSVLIAGCSGNKKDSAAEEPYNRSQRVSYERKVRYSVLVPFMYEGKFYAYYALGKKLSGPDKKGYYDVEFKNGPQAGNVITTKDIIIKTRPADSFDLKRGMVVLVNHWNPKQHNDAAKVDMWRKGVVYNLDKVGDGLVMLEFPHDTNDFMATKEVYNLDNIRLILAPEVKDPRIFLD